MIAQEYDSLKKSHKELQQLLQYEKQRSTTLESNLHGVEDKYHKLCKNFPSNSLHTITMYHHWQTTDKQKRALHGEYQQALDLVDQLRASLSHSQSNCGQLYNEKNDLQVKVWSIWIV